MSHLPSHPHQLLHVGANWGKLQQAEFEGLVTDIISVRDIVRLDADVFTFAANASSRKLGSRLHSLGRSAQNLAIGRTPKARASGHYRPQGSPPDSGGGGGGSARDSRRQVSRGAWGSDRSTGAGGGGEAGGAGGTGGWLPPDVHFEELIAQLVDYGTHCRRHDDEGLMLILHVLQALVQRGETQRNVRDVQDILNRLGAVQMVFAQMCDARGDHTNEVYRELVVTGIALLQGGNPNVQASFYRLMQQRSHAFLGELSRKVESAMSELQATPEQPEFDPYGTSAAAAAASAASTIAVGSAMATPGLPAQFTGAPPLAVPSRDSLKRSHSVEAVVKQGSKGSSIGSGASRPGPPPSNPKSSKRSSGGGGGGGGGGRSPGMPLLGKMRVQPEPLDTSSPIIAGVGAGAGAGAGVGILSMSPQVGGGGGRGKFKV